MTAYVIARLGKAPVHAEVLTYLERIAATLVPFAGRFIVHGGAVDVLEGDWSGDVVVLEFPDATHARSWYQSSDYQEIKPLRTRHLTGEVILVDGVEPGHVASQLAATIRRATDR
ncbi:DUF1330 domain-containing protein [Micromonospora inaquosa]|uniref:DUF1330 domain-containing protein n=1 Tax=Micromonospora inaquosa TaxID=2203716 RepID=UPI0033FFFF66